MSQVSRANIMDKLKTRRDHPLKHAKHEAQAIQFSTGDEFADCASANGALITFSPSINAALHAIRQLCEENGWLHSPVFAPSLKTAVQSTGLWPRNNLDVESTGAIAVTQAYCGIADTGTLLLFSSPENPTRLNFLPEHHIVLLDTKRVVTTKQDAWQLMRQEQRVMPRAINLVSGPSRTADIEQTIQLGAHGPRSLTVVLID